MQLKNAILRNQPKKKKKIQTNNVNVNKQYNITSLYQPQTREKKSPKTILSQISPRAKKQKKQQNVRCGNYLNTPKCKKTTVRQKRAKKNKKRARKGQGRTKRGREGQEGQGRGRQGAQRATHKRANPLWAASTRKTPPDRAGKGPIRAQKVRLGPFFERGDTR